jgi:hypothetical protein
LLAGLMPSDLKEKAPFSLEESPTRFGRVTLRAEPWGVQGWKMRFSSEGGTEQPQAIEVSEKLDDFALLVRVEGAMMSNAKAGIVNVDARFGIDSLLGIVVPLRRAHSPGWFHTPALRSSR